MWGRLFFLIGHTHVVPKVQIARFHLYHSAELDEKVLQAFSVEFRAITVMQIQDQFISVWFPANAHTNLPTKQVPRTHESTARRILPTFIPLSISQVSADQRVTSGHFAPFDAVVVLSCRIWLNPFRGSRENFG